MLYPKIFILYTQVHIVKPQLAVLAQSVPSGILVSYESKTKKNTFSTFCVNVSLGKQLRNIGVSKTIF